MRSLFIALSFTLVAAVAVASTKDNVVVEGGVTYTIHKIAKGETLYSLAKQYNVSLDEIYGANEELTDNVKVGQKIKIPTKTVEIAEAKLEETKRDLEAVAAEKAEQTEKVEIAEKSEPTEKESKHHKEPKHHKVSKQEEPNSDEPKQEQPKQEQTAQTESVGSSEAPAEQKKDSLTLVAEQSASLLQQVMEHPDSTVVVAEPKPLPFRRLRKGECAEVVLMLPLGSTAQPAEQYIDFYRGFLLGLDSVRMAGYSVKLNVYNTARDTVRVNEIIASGVLEKANLVIGPVYEEEMKPVLKSLEGKGIPVVSPLASYTDVKSEELFQMAPSSASRFKKISHLLDGSRRVVIISTDHSDKKFDETFRAMLNDSVKVVEKIYSSAKQQYVARSSSELLALIRGADQPVVFVNTTNEYEVDRILTALNSVRQSLYRYHNGEPFILVGHASWARFKNMEKLIFFKSGVTLFNTYYAQHNDHNSRLFERRFIHTYGSIPTLFAYRGHDAASLFIKSLFSEAIENKLEGKRFVPLTTPYLFEKNEETGVRVNTEWIWQRYNRDYTITFK